jgi:sporulation protein YlmC with PRC-barrel domain
MRLELGMPVHGADGELGILADVVVDPGSCRVTHLVVEPRHRPALARLVPIELATHDDADDGRLGLLCSAHQLRRLPEAREIAHGRRAPLDDGLDLEPRTAVPPAFIYDRIPKGEAELRRGSPVITADGRHVGRVAEVLADDGDRIAGVVLRRRWFQRPRRLTIPADALARVETDWVTLRVDRRELVARAR